MAEVIFDIGFHEDDYIFMPACCYNGNRFNVIKRDYPPMYTPEEASVDIETCITDVPRLDKDASGAIEVTTGDVSVPCVGVFSPSRKKAWLVFTVQEIGGINLGLAWENGRISITYPAKRREYYNYKMYKSTCDYAPMEAEIPHKMLEFGCESITEFYSVFFRNRKIMGMDCTLPEVLSKKEQWEIQRDKLNAVNWHEEGQFYSHAGGSDEPNYTWQPGWVGGAMNTYALLKLGGPLERQRSMKTLEHLFRLQGDSGLFYGACDNHLNIVNDGFTQKGAENYALLRKSADVLYFVLRQFPLMDSVPSEFERGIRKTADRFVSLWRENGMIGQFADVNSGKLTVGNSCSAAIVSAGLCEAYKYFSDKEYLTCATEIADYHYKNFILKGITTGGPGEILQCPDSESAFGMLESCVCLYETVKDEKYLRYAVDTLHQCSSWAVPYNYKFPRESEFGRLGAKSVGSVFANIQNKHSAPGICTLSGSSIRKVYEWTGEELYLDLYREITHTISQYMSTEKRPVFAHDGTRLAPGTICERVNMSDWEGSDWVGEVFNASCWCETSNLLWLADM